MLAGAKQGRGECKIAVNERRIGDGGFTF